MPVTIDRDPPEAIRSALSKGIAGSTATLFPISNRARPRSASTRSLPMKRATLSAACAAHVTGTRFTSNCCGWLITHAEPESVDR